MGGGAVEFEGVEGFAEDVVCAGAADVSVEGFARGEEPAVLFHLLFVFFEQAAEFWVDGDV